MKFGPATKKLQLSKFFDWFKDDFLAYLKEKKGVAQSHISQYILMYLDEPTRAALEKIPVSEISVNYFSYNKSLNEQMKTGRQLSSGFQSVGDAYFL